jgi:hypothetical protein
MSPSLGKALLRITICSREYTSVTVYVSLSVFSFQSQTSRRNEVVPFRSEFGRAPAEFRFIPCLSVTSHSGIPVGVSALFEGIIFRSFYHVSEFWTRIRVLRVENEKVRS